MYMKPDRPGRNVHCIGMRPLPEVLATQDFQVGVDSYRHILPSVIHSGALDRNICCFIAQRARARAV